MNYNTYVCVRVCIAFTWYKYMSNSGEILKFELDRNSK